jgi:acyl-CoA thioesterase-1
LIGSNARTIIAGCAAFLLAFCGGRGDEPPAGRPAESVAAAKPAPPGRGDEPTVVFLGTSLTAGLGLDPDSAYPAIVQRLIDSAGRHFTVINAGVSGESSAGALRRIDWILKSPPAVLVIETGANDGLRGQDPDSIRANIQAIIDRVRTTAPRTRIILAGMEAMPNLGVDYVRRFRAIYPALAQRNHLTLIPFLLYRVGGVDTLNQQDGIHPNNAGSRIVAHTVWKTLEQVLP